MEEAIKKADVLVEAMSWIRQFRGQTTVIKLGGSVMKDEAALEQILHDVVFMETVGMHPIVIHGGGSAISHAMAEAGLEARFEQGRRYTDEASLQIVEEVLVNRINPSLADSINKLGGKAVALNFNTQNVLRGQRLALVTANGEEIDLGYVGEVTNVDGGLLKQLCSECTVPVIPSMCIDEAGQKYNVNADTAATAIAVSLRADKLVFISDVNGVRRDKNDPASLIDSLDESLARELMLDGTIDSGMIPKIESCLETLNRGVGKVHIIDGSLRHSLLLEIYTNSGVGTEIVK